MALSSNRPCIVPRCRRHFFKVPSLSQKASQIEPQKEFYGIDSEASASGAERMSEDIHTIQICSSKGEQSGRVFWKAEDFKEWFRHKNSRPEIFFAFTIAFEYGSLAAWELLRAIDERGHAPWQNWSDKPINLFYIQIDRTRIPVYDVRSLFFQLRYGNTYLTNLRAVADYLSDFYGEDVHKLDEPLGEDFGKRAPAPSERRYFEAYGIRDAYICAKAAQWIHENILEKWLKSAVPITKIYSWGTVAKHFFNLPKINKVVRYGSRYYVEFPNLWHQRIFDSTFAGRSEAFATGNVGQVFYNDVSSLYPTSIIQTQCLLIRDVQQWHGKTDALLGKINTERFFEATGTPYGWILGDFQVTDDLWSLPIKVGANNCYVTGTFRNMLYNSLDLEAGRAEVLNVDRVLVPVFADEHKDLMKKYEQLTETKLQGTYASEIEKYCIKSTLNSTSGILGKSHPSFGDTTNIPAYNIMLGQSHLYMSEIFHKYHTAEHPIVYCDTDSFFWFRPVAETVRECEPYPTLPFQVLDTVPLKVEVKGKSRKEGTVIFRGKMYYQNKKSLAFSSWKPFPKFFYQIIKTRPTEITIERQVSRKWRTRDKKATTLKVGRWFIKEEPWNLQKLEEIFRADTKRWRPTNNSYALFLNDERADSRAWTIDETFDMLEKTAWIV